MDSVALGKHFYPVMEKIKDRIPNLVCAVLCGTDGFNLCSMGLNEGQVGKMAALASSLFAIGESTNTTLHKESGEQEKPLDIITMHSDRMQIVMMKIERSGMPLLLMASANSMIGVVINGVRATAHELNLHT
jgi:predicted regulator of Ras-like GTPase activity (Roadblock/LC7/MglB family)